MPCSDCQKSKTLQNLKEEIEKLKQKNADLENKIKKAALLQKDLFTKDTILRD
jgi:cell division protein FtsB